MFAVLGGDASLVSVIVALGIGTYSISVLWYCWKCNWKRKSIGKDVHIVIIGGGMSGICMGVNLLKNKHTNFTIIEKGKSIGGTWYYNRYPGCGCDIPAPLYSFSFANWPEWDRLWAYRSQILEYIKWVVKKNDLSQYIRLGTRVKDCIWNEKSNMWEITCVECEESYEIREDRKERGRKYTLASHYLINASGPLRVPSFPSSIKGIDRLSGETVFQGSSFHSTWWPSASQISMKGKRVGVVGTGASAVQLIPQVAAEAKELTVFQRTPNWIVPKKKLDSEFGPFSKSIKRTPIFGEILMTIQRWMIYWSFEERLRKFYPGHHNDASREELKEHIKSSLGGENADPELVEKLTPKYPPGCKRVLIFSGYFETFLRKNVKLVTAPIREILPNSVKLMKQSSNTSGKKQKDVKGDFITEEKTIPLDVLIFATGFDTMSARDLNITGASGCRMKDWRDNDCETLHGIMSSKFPNMFFLLGPNTGLGHNSVIWMLECQTAYICDLLSQLSSINATRVVPRNSRVAEFMTFVNTELKKKVWVSCSSWYRHAKTKNVFALWPCSTLWYWWTTKSADLNDYDVSSIATAK